jgi:CBS domain containing-hemolysin-like protein
VLEIHEVYILIAFSLALLLDLTTIAARAALRHSSLAGLICLHEQEEPDAEHSLDLLRSMPRPYAGLHLTQSFARFLMIGCVYLILQKYGVDLLLKLVGALLGIGLLVAWLEWITERRVMRNPERWVLRLSTFARYLTLALTPLVNLSLFFSQELKETRQNSSVFTEDELRTLVDVGQKDGILEQDEHKMIQSVFRLGDTLVREIMVPRIDVNALEIGASLSDAVSYFLSSGFSRLPVYEETVDNILGLLYAKDLLEVWQGGNQQTYLRPDMLREAYFVPEAKKVDELLAEMQIRRVHMAIVMDEYGGVAGVVTLEDIIEEIFGEIQDEYDDGEELPYRLMENGDYLFLGRIDLDDFNEIMDCQLSNNDADTLGGFIYARLGRVPTKGERVEANGLMLTVEHVSNRRIRKVRAQSI